MALSTIQVICAGYHYYNWGYADGGKFLGALAVVGLMLLLRGRPKDATNEVSVLTGFLYVCLCLTASILIYLGFVWSTPKIPHPGIAFPFLFLPYILSTLGIGAHTKWKSIFDNTTEHSAKQDPEDKDNDSAE